MSDSLPIPVPPTGVNTAVDVSLEQVAQVYARALVQAGEHAGQTEALLGELDSLLDDCLRQLPDLRSILASGLIDSAERIALLDKAFAGRASPLLLNFLKVLVSNERFDALEPIRHAAHKLYDELRGRVAVELTTAVPLDGAVVERLKGPLRALLGGEPQITARTNPELIGGALVRVGDTVYDGSLATGLRRLREQMISRSVHEIQSRRDRFGS